MKKTEKLHFLKCRLKRIKYLFPFISSVDWNIVKYIDTQSETSDAADLVVTTAAHLGENQSRTEASPPVAAIKRSHLSHKAEL